MEMHTLFNFLFSMFLAHLHKNVQLKFSSVYNDLLTKYQDCMWKELVLYNIKHFDEEEYFIRSSEYLKLFI